MRDPRVMERVVTPDYPDLSLWSPSLPGCSGWSLGGRERHDGQVTMSGARTQLSSDHRCYNFSWQPVESGEAWDRWPVHTGRPGETGHYSHDAGSASQGKHTRIVNNRGLGVNMSSDCSWVEKFLLNRSKIIADTSHLFSHCAAVTISPPTPASRQWASLVCPPGAGAV